MDIVTKKDFKMLSGEVIIPADKSISHRAIIFSALAKGKSIIKNYKRRKKYFTKLADTNYKKYLAKKDIFMYNYLL